METTRNWFGSVIGYGWLLALAIGLAGCSKTSIWREEVQLSDGRIITVEREIRFEGGGGEWAHNRSLSKPKEQRIRFPSMDGSSQPLEWQSTKSSPAGWPEYPLILDVDADVPLVFSIMSINGACEKYFKYSYHNGAWNEEPLPGKFDMRQTNLYLKVGDDMQKVNLEEKRNENSSVDYPKSYKQVGPSLLICG